MMKFWLAGALLIPANPVAAQLAAPQYRLPAEDSTFIQGVAERVMPVPGPPPAPEPGNEVQRPRSIEEFLKALAGTDIYYREYQRGSGWPDMPAWLRISVADTQARVQYWNLGNQHQWRDLCSLSSGTPQCVAEVSQSAGLTTFSYPVRVSVSANAIMLTGTACLNSYSGSITASGSYSWDDAQAQAGKFDNIGGYGGYYLQGASYAGDCSYTLYSD